MVGEDRNTARLLVGPAACMGICGRRNAQTDLAEARCCRVCWASAIELSCDIARRWRGQLGTGLQGRDQKTVYCGTSVGDYSAAQPLGNGDILMSLGTRFTCVFKGLKDRI